ITAGACFSAKASIISATWRAAAVSIDCNHRKSARTRKPGAKSFKMSTTRWAACFASSFVTRPAALITTRRLDLSASTEYIIRADFYVLISTDEFPQLLHFAFFVHIDSIMATRTGSAVWEGTLKEGKGKMKLGSGAFEGPYSFASRFENASGTNPEELIGAAEAGCFSMALSFNLEKAGHPANKINTTAEVKLEPS